MDGNTNWKWLDLGVCNFFYLFIYLFEYRQGGKKNWRNNWLIQNWHLCVCVCVGVWVCVCVKKYRNKNSTKKGRRKWKRWSIPVSRIGGIHAALMTDAAFVVAIIIIIIMILVDDCWR